MSQDGVGIPNGRLLTPQLLVPNVKPTFPVAVDWSHILARGLQSFMLFNENGYKDLVTGKVRGQEDDITGTPEYSITGGESGYATKSVVDEDGISFDVGASASDSETLFTRIKPAFGSLFQRAVSLGDPSAVASSTLVIYLGKPRFQRQDDVGTDKVTISGGSYIDDEWLNMCGGYDGGVHHWLAHMSRRRTWHGTSDSSAYGGQPTLSRYSIGGRFANGSWGDMFAGNISITAYWNRSLSLPEAFSMNKDPYQFLAMV